MPVEEGVWDIVRAAIPGSGHRRSVWLERYTFAETLSKSSASPESNSDPTNDVPNNVETDTTQQMLLIGNDATNEQQGHFFAEAENCMQNCNTNFPL